MILGLSFADFTLVHVVISLIGILSGIIVLAGMLMGRSYPALTALFLGTTVLTSYGPSHIVGVISLMVLAIALAALYGFHLTGAWRLIYVASAVAALYLYVFVGVVQYFQKLSLLQPLAPTQSEPPFIIAQLVVLVIFVLAGFAAVRAFHPERPVAAIPG
jgi:hypothetical protein